MSSVGERVILGQQRADKPILPPEKVFSIQIGSKLFRLSGASISSDAPSYFSQFFGEQLKVNNGGALPTLYIDRDPITFQDICKHLQGYHIRPRDGEHFVKLFADAQFYNLPRLTSQLFESDIFIQIGERKFQISRDVFSGPGNTPNFFSLGFAMFFSAPKDLFPGLDRKNLLRPPAIMPPMVSNRSGEIFAELLHMLRGYPVLIRSEEHRAALLRDCRYYHLRGLEQNIIPHHISYNFEKGTSEIAIRLEDIRQSGIKLVPDVSHPEKSWLHYARPFVDDSSHELILELGQESMCIDLSKLEARLHGQTKAKLSKLLEVIAKNIYTPAKTPSKSSPGSTGSASQTLSPTPTTVSLEKVFVNFDESSCIVLNGREYTGDTSDIASLPENVRQLLVGSSEPPRKRPREEDPKNKAPQWIVHNGQWRVQAIPFPGMPMMLVLWAVKVDVSTSQRARNAKRVFLGS